MQWNSSHIYERHFTLRCLPGLHSTSFRRRPPFHATSISILYYCTIHTHSDTFRVPGIIPYEINITYYILRPQANTLRSYDYARVTILHRPPVLCTPSRPVVRSFDAGFRNLPEYYNTSGRWIRSVSTRNTSELCPKNIKHPITNLPAGRKMLAPRPFVSRLWVMSPKKHTLR